MLRNLHGLITITSENYTIRVLDFYIILNGLVPEAKLSMDKNEERIKKPYIKFIYKLSIIKINIR